jgi:hypothetical protein
MTTAKLYQKVKAGEISRSRFLYEVRRDSNLPWVTNVTSYEDAVKILKSKSIISEGATMAMMQHGSVPPDHEGDAYSSNAEVAYDEKEVLSDVKTFLARGYSYSEALELAAEHGIESDDLEFNPTFSKDAIDTEEYEDQQPINEAHDLTTAQIIDRLNPYEFKRGVDYEMSKLKVLDNISLEKVKEKVAKKMAKDPLAYRYTQLANAKQIEKDDNRLSMKPVKGDNSVDKENGMKKIKGHTDEKKNTSTPKTENRKGKPKGVKEMKGSKKKPSGVKDVMKSETKETVLNEMIAFFKKKDRLKENDVSFSGGGATPQARSDFHKGSEVITPQGPGIVIDTQGSIVNIELLSDKSKVAYTYNVLDAAKEKANQTQIDADKAKRDADWSEFDRKQSTGENPYAKPFGGTLEYKPEDIHTLLKKFKAITEKLKLKKEVVKKNKAGKLASVGNDAASQSLANKMGYTQTIPGEINPL